MQGAQCKENMSTCQIIAFFPIDERVFMHCSLKQYRLCFPSSPLFPARVYVCVCVVFPQAPKPYI